MPPRLLAGVCFSALLTASMQTFFASMSLLHHSPHDQSGPDNMATYLGKLDDTNLGPFSDKIAEESLASKHFLRYVQLDEFIGKGTATVTFSVDTTRLQMAFPQSFDNTKSYVIKFTGDMNRRGQYDTHFADYGAIAYEISKRISSHPSIPTTVFFEKSVINPFRDGTLMAPNTTSSIIMDRLMASTNMSIAVVESVRPTPEHLDDDGYLTLLPLDQIYCFWKRLFENLDFVHAHNVSMHDTALWNTILQDGEVMLFDWHMGEIFVEDSSGLPKGYEQLTATDQPHFHDTNRVGKRIKEQLKRLASRAISPEDAHRLTDLYKIMQAPNPPTLGSLLRTHEYFMVHANDTCTLMW